MPQTKSFWDHPIDTIEEALSIRKQIGALQEKLSSLFGDHPPSTASSSKPRRRTMSAAARAKIAAAQRARWAKSKGTSSAASKAPTAVTITTTSPPAPAQNAGPQRPRGGKTKTNP